MTQMAAAQTTTAGALYRRLAVLGLALFVYLTAELFPIGALNDLAIGLHVAPATAGLLLAPRSEDHQLSACCQDFQAVRTVALADCPFLLTGCKGEFWRRLSVNSGVTEARFGPGVSVNFDAAAVGACGFGRVSWLVGEVAVGTYLERRANGPLTI
jgi:hypothetical protein